MDTVTLTGGEPLLRADFADLLRLLTGHARSVVLLTNATLVTAATAQEIVEAGVIPHVSVDHLDLKHTDKVRGGTRRTLSGLEHLLQAGAKELQITVVLTAENWTSLESMLLFALEHSATLEIIPVSVVPGHPLDLQTISEENRRILAEVLEEWGQFLGRSTYYSRLVRWLVAGSLSPVRYCRTGAKGIFVDSDGEVSVCGRRRSSLGNISEQTAAEILARRAGELSLRSAGPCAAVDCLHML